MKQGYFSSPQDSHVHSLRTLSALYEYDDFMESVGTMADVGCGHGMDLEWWATRTTRDEQRRPLNIRCTGIDRAPRLGLDVKYRNISYLSQDFEQPITQPKRSFDVIWCHDSFQYAINPLKTLAQWHEAMSPDGMLILVLPQSTNMEFRTLAYDQRDYCYFNYTLVSLIHMLAVSGFDCAGGFFLKDRSDPWLHAVVYRSEILPQNPATTSWYHLAEQGLLPVSAAESVNRYGFLRQRDLVLPWLDRGLVSYQDA